MDLEDGADVDLWVVKSLVTQLLDGGQTLVGDVILQQCSQLSKAVRDAGNKLEGKLIMLYEHLIPRINPGNRKYLEHPAKVFILVSVEQVLEL